MSDLIRRQAAIDAFLTELTKRERENLHHTWSTVEVKYFVVDMLEKLPSADRPQGEWKPFDLTWGRSIYACSACEEAIAVPCGWSGGKPIYDYCPMCGARMKGADDEV